MTTKLPASVLDFDQFLNEPPENEDKRYVRDYRHTAYRKWEGVLRDIEKLALEACASAAASPVADDGLFSELHPDTVDLVRRFSVALRAKLAVAQGKYGYTNGWLDKGWMDECRAHLLEHVAKGDPRDVAAYCAFLWHHGESTAASGVGSPVAAAALLECVDSVLERAPCDCSDKRRYEKGEHLSGCYLFDLNIARNRVGSPVGAAGMVLVPLSLVDEFPEINPSNYDHDDVCALNAWGVELVRSVPPIGPENPKEPILGSMEWVAQAAGLAATPAPAAPPKCKGPNECPLNKACMYSCGSNEYPGIVSVPAAPSEVSEHGEKTVAGMKIERMGEGHFTVQSPSLWFQVHSSEDAEDNFCRELVEVLECLWKTPLATAPAVPVGVAPTEETRLKAALKWYADGNHFAVEDWDTVSGEPQNWLHAPDDMPAMIEDGGVARTVLAGGHMVEDDELICEPLMTPEQHAAKLAEVERLIKLDPAPDSMEDRMLEVESAAVERYEQRMFPLLAATTVVPVQAQLLTDEQKDRLTDVAFEATNNTEATAMCKFWFRKGLTAAAGLPVEVAK